MKWYFVLEDFVVSEFVNVCDDYGVQVGECKKF